MNLALIFILLGFITYTMFAPIVPATYGKPMVQNTDKIFAGQVFSYEIHTCRHVSESVVADITRQIVSTTNKDLAPISLSSDSVTNEKGCVTRKKTLIIPYSTPPGTYQLVVKGSYSIIPIRSPILVSATSDSFNVQSPNNTPLDAALRAIQEGTTPNGIYRDGNNSSQPETQTGAPINSNPPTTTVPNSNTNTANNNGNNNNNGSGSNPPSPALDLPGLLNALGGGNVDLKL